jgi:hypothetical protein
MDPGPQHRDAVRRVLRDHLTDLLDRLRLELPLELPEPAGSPVESGAAIATPLRMNFVAAPG